MSKKGRHSAKIFNGKRQRYNKKNTDNYIYTMANYYTTIINTCEICDNAGIRMPKGSKFRWRILYSLRKRKKA